MVLEGKRALGEEDGDGAHIGCGEGGPQVDEQLLLLKRAFDEGPGSLRKCLHIGCYANNIILSAFAVLPVRDLKAGQELNRPVLETASKMFHHIPCETLE